LALLLGNLEAASRAGLPSPREVLRRRGGLQQELSRVGAGCQPEVGLHVGHRGGEAGARDVLWLTAACICYSIAPPRAQEGGVSAVNGTAPSVRVLSCYSCCSNILMSVHPEHFLPLSVTGSIKEAHRCLHVYLQHTPPEAITAFPNK
jgi:hypothetical protein